MRAKIIGSGTIIWAAGASPAGQDIDVPLGCTGVYVFTDYWTSSPSTGAGVASMTLDGKSFSEGYNNPGMTALTIAGQLHTFYDPMLGNQELIVTFDGSPGEGPICHYVFIEGGGPWRDIGSDATEGATPCTVDIKTDSLDLVIKLDSRFAGTQIPPGLSSGWTSLETLGHNDHGARTSYLTTPQHSIVTVDSEDDNWSQVLGVSIPPGVVETRILPVSTIGRRVVIDRPGV